jgi:hypothetical protein
LRCGSASDYCGASFQLASSQKRNFRSRATFFRREEKEQVANLLHDEKSKKH